RDLPTPWWSARNNFMPHIAFEEISPELAGVAAGERVAANGRGGVSRDKRCSPSTPGTPPRGLCAVGWLEWAVSGQAPFARVATPASSGQDAASFDKERDIVMLRGERPAHDAFVVLPGPNGGFSPLSVRRCLRSARRNSWS